MGSVAPISLFGTPYISHHPSPLAYFLAGLFHASFPPRFFFPIALSLII